MRILSVTQTYWPFLEFGGPPVKVRALGRGLTALGHQVTVLTADWGFEQRVGDPAAAGAERSPFGWRHMEDGVRTIYLPTWLRYRATSWNPAVKRFCRARLSEFDMAHIYGLYDFLGPAVARACSEAGLPYVLEPIGMYVPIVRNFFLKRTYHAIYGKRLFAGAAKVVATSEQEVEELVGGGVPRDQIRLRRNGVEAPLSWPERGRFRKKIEIAEDVPLVLFLGRLAEKKSPDLLLRAFAELSRDEIAQSWQLVFVGPEEEGMEARLRQLARELGVHSRVKFTGPVYGEEKWSAYRDANVFVLPSQNENFGNAAAEAIAAGTPVVVTDQCGIAPLLADKAGLVVPHDAVALARAIKQVITEHDLRERLAEGCKEVAMKLGWEEPVRQMEILYNELAKASGASAKSSGNSTGK
jgi:glycosyltransferase involved in cell wall biosynthesis